MPPAGAACRSRGPATPATASTRARITLDWGTITPLWFLGHGRNMVGYGDAVADPPVDAGPPVVIAAPERSLPRSAMVAFGAAVAEAAARDGRRVAFVASCDWGHTHQASGPYGYHPAAAAVDALVVQAIQESDPGRLIDLDEQQVQDAAIDGLWQTLMLAGALEHTPMRGEVLCYEAPTYYGMIVAAFTPDWCMRHCVVCISAAMLTWCMSLRQQGI